MRGAAADAALLRQLQALWQTCFGDDAAYTSRFFAHFPPSRHSFVAREGEKVAAMVHWVPHRLRLNGQDHPAAYLYAVATDPSFRGRGLCRQLTAYAEQCLADEGIAVTTLVPASDSLFDFYRKLGYETAFSCCQWQQRSEDAAPTGCATPVAAETYAHLRHRWLPADSALWPDDVWRYQALVSRASGTALYRLEDGCAVCERSSSGLFIKELLGCADPKGAAAALMAANGAQQALVRTPGGQRPLGMLHWLRGIEPVPEQAYLGLAFD